MAKSSTEAYGASGKTNVLIFEPEALVLVDDPNHALYDPRVGLPVDEALVLNIMFQGVIEPIVITKDAETGETIVVAGRQRVKAAREANRRLKERGDPCVSVPAVVRRGTDSALAAVMVSENEIRQEDTPLVKAGKMQKLIDMGRSEQDLMVIFGVTMTTIKSYLSLLECSKPVQKAIEEGKVSVTVATKLARLDPAEQKAKLEEVIEAGEGKKGHERSKAIANVVDKAKKLRSRKEIEKAQGETPDPIVIRTLDWVLGNIDTF